MNTITQPIDPRSFMQDDELTWETDVIVKWNVDNSNFNRRSNYSEARKNHIVVGTFDYFTRKGNVL